MEAIIYNSSPRGKKSNTNIITSAFARGLTEANCSVEQFYLAGCEIAPCTGCFSCFKKKSRTCCMNDDMPRLLDKFISADLVVLAGPVYFDTFNGLMKNFIDRLLPLLDPHLETDQAGQSNYGPRFEKYPFIGIIANAGHTGPENFKIIRAQIHKLAKTFRTGIAFEIYRDQGELLQEKNHMLGEEIEQYKKLVKKAAFELVNLGTISPDLNQRLNAPLVSNSLYTQAANMSWDRIYQNQ